MELEERLASALRSQTDLVTPTTVDLEVLRAAARKQSRRRMAVVLSASALVVATAAFLTHDAPERSTEPVHQPGESVPAGPSQTADDSTWPANMYFLDLRTGKETRVAGDLVADDLDNAWYVFSPDGTKVAYNTCSEGPCADQNEIRIGDADGTHTDATFEGEHALAWSPDGDKLVYSAPAPIADSDHPNLYVRDIASGRTTGLLDPSTARWLRSVDFGPNDVDVSPDGGTVLFSRPRASADKVPTWDVWAAPINGGEASLVLRDAPGRVAASSRLYSPQFLSDGERIAFPQSDRLISVAGPGESPQAFVPTDTPMWAWALSPDRTRIAYDSEQGTHIIDLNTVADSLVTDGQRARWVGNDTLFVEVPAR